MSPAWQTLRQPNEEQPVFVIVAGPNGSGKSSVYENADMEAFGRSIWIINPDLLTARLRDAEMLDQHSANFAAVTRIEAWLDASIAVHKSVGVETVLSTSKYRRLVEKAKQHGFAVWLIYVLLDSAERNIERIALRVKKGGHAVPDDKVRDRYVRSLNQMPWFLEQADRGWIYDNSSAQPKLVGTKQDGIVTLYDDALPVLIEKIGTIRSD